MITWQAPTSAAPTAAVAPTATASTVHVWPVIVRKAATNGDAGFIVTFAYPRGVEYPNVKSAHIVPRTYLLNWGEGGKIGVRLDGEPQSRVLPIEGVGTRRRFYRRERPDGTLIDDIEWSLGQGETATAPVLRSFEHRWPLVREDKLKVAELFAYQLLRGPRWKDEHEALTRRFIADYRRDGIRTDDGQTRWISEEELETAERVFQTDSYRFIRMLILGPTIATILVSMHWTLVGFASPVIAHSDHPSVL